MKSHFNLIIMLFLLTNISLAQNIKQRINYLFVWKNGTPKFRPNEKTLEIVTGGYTILERQDNAIFKGMKDTIVSKKKFKVPVKVKANDDLRRSGVYSFDIEKNIIHLMVLKNQQRNIENSFPLAYNDTITSNIKNTNYNVKTCRLPDTTINTISFGVSICYRFRTYSDFEGFSGHFKYTDIFIDKKKLLPIADEYFLKHDGEKYYFIIP